MIQGIERSGKGTIARILQMLAGPSNCCGPTLNSLTEQFGLWALTDKTLAVIGDARLPKKGTEVITERLLSIIGEDTMQVDRKWQRPWQGKMPSRIVLLSNEIPNWSDSAGVLPTRWIVATTVKSYLGKEDPNLLDRLSSELPGILNWALDGLDRLIKQQRFTLNEATPEVVGAQRERSAPQKGFVEELCVLGEDKWITKDRLREMWTFWNAQHGRTVTDTRESFTTKLLAMVPTVKAKDQKKRIEGRLTPIFRGISLVADHPELAAERDREEREQETGQKSGPVQEALPIPPQSTPGTRNEPPAHDESGVEQRTEPEESCPSPSAPTRRTPSTRSSTGTPPSTPTSTTATATSSADASTRTAHPNRTPTEAAARPPSTPSADGQGPARPPS
jgi:phage/plasmid-associated DNA primase